MLRYFIKITECADPSKTDRFDQLYHDLVYKHTYIVGHMGRKIILEEGTTPAQWAKMINTSDYFYGFQDPHSAQAFADAIKCHHENASVYLKHELRNDIDYQCEVITVESTDYGPYWDQWYPERNR